MTDLPSGNQKLDMLALTSLVLHVGNEKFLAATATDEHFQEWASKLANIKRSETNTGWAPEQRLHFINFLIENNALKNTSRVGE